MGTEFTYFASVTDNELASEIKKIALKSCDIDPISASVRNYYFDEHLHTITSYNI